MRSRGMCTISNEKDTTKIIVWWCVRVETYAQANWRFENILVFIFFIIIFTKNNSYTYSISSLSIPKKCGPWCSRKKGWIFLCYGQNYK